MESLRYVMSTADVHLAYRTDDDYDDNIADYY